MGFPIATVAARLLARPILQEYYAFTVDVLAGIPPQSILWKWQLLVAQLTNLVISHTADLGICKRHNLVEIAGACRREADACTMDDPTVWKCKQLSDGNRNIHRR